MKPSKIQIAVGRIVVREPFFASILLGIEIFEDPSIPTFCTNGIAIKYNPDFLNTLSDEEVIAVLVHEVEHIARLHPWRREGREPAAWNCATDYSINEELEKARFSLPKGALLNPGFDGMSEEAIYNALPKNPSGGSGQGQGQGQGKGKGQGKPGQGQGKAGQGQGKSGQGSGQGQPQPQPGAFGQVEDCPGTQAEKEAAKAQAKVEIIRAAMVAKQQGRLPASMESWVESIRHPKVPWQDQLRDYVSAFARDDYSWQRPNRRYEETGFTLPSLRNFRCGCVAVAIDTSGSIGQIEFEQFMGELRDILETVKPERLILLQADAEVADYRVLENGETLDDKIQMCGGGGTDFRPVFDRIEEEGEQPEVLIYLTDACGSFPDQAPGYPVIWAVTTDAETPWGDRIRVSLEN